MRCELTDETNGQDALHELVLDAMRRTDAASTATAPGHPLDLIGRARSLHWDDRTESPLELVGRRLLDLASVAAAIHRGRVAAESLGCPGATASWETSR